MIYSPNPRLIKNILHNTEVQVLQFLNGWLECSKFSLTVLEFEWLLVFLLRYEAILGNFELRVTHITHVFHI